jgi:hypothetical protein
MWAAWTEHKVFANRRQDLIAVTDQALKNNIVILLRRTNFWIGHKTHCSLSPGQRITLTRWLAADGIDSGGHPFASSTSNTFGGDIGRL